MLLALSSLCNELSVRDLNTEVGTNFAGGAALLCSKSLAK
jgi:hypothetical protein